LIGVFLKAIGYFFEAVTTSADRSSFELIVRLAALAASTLTIIRILFCGWPVESCSSLNEVVTVTNDEDASVPEGGKNLPPGDVPRTG